MSKLEPLKVKFYRYTLLPNESGCMLWIGCLGRKKGLDGYGQIKVKGKKCIMAHRFSYEIHNGKIPEGLFVCHKCDIPTCVAPEHLFLGTHQDNMKDRSKKNRCNITQGENSYLAAFTNKQAAEIREIYKKGGISTRQLAKQFNVSQPCIRNVIHRKSYKNS